MAHGDGVDRSLLSAFYGVVVAKKKDWLVVV